jgi:ATPase subunit of ABC transporter with duplicated ATPase domains
LLLDEPTNFLDKEQVLWFPMTMIFLKKFRVVFVMWTRELSENIPENTLIFLSKNNT